MLFLRAVLVFLVMVLVSLWTVTNIKAIVYKLKERRQKRNESENQKGS